MSRVEDQTLEGHYAGVISRLLAWILDSFLAVSLYGVVVSAAVFVWNVTVRRDLEVPTEDSLAWVIGLVAWIAFYFAGSWALWGKTVGKAVVGLRIVRRDGGDLEPGRALRRAIVFPVDFLTLGIGFAWALVDREHRTFHDMLAGTAVVYDWEARAPRLRNLLDLGVKRPG
jgi:uncharacterized RDD family membrane protein YckC